MARWLVPAATAAAVLLVAIMAYKPATQRPKPLEPPYGRQDVVEKLLGDFPAEDQFIVEFLEFFHNYELCGLMAENEPLLDIATLEALDSLEAKGI